MKEGDVAVIAGELAYHIGLAGAEHAVGKALAGIVAVLKLVHLHVIIGDVGAFERRAVERLEAGQLAGGDGIGLGDAGQRGVVDLAALMRPRANVEPRAGGGDGGEVEIFLHELVEQGRQLGIGSSGGRGFWWCAGRNGERGGSHL